MINIVNIADSPGKEVLALLADIHAEAFSGQGERPWAAAEILALIEMPGTAVLLATFGDKPAGFLIYRSAVDEAELITLAVKTTFRGNRIAFRLISQMICRLRAIKVEKIFLEVREDNARAIKLYEDFGFEIAGKRSGYYHTQSGKLIDALCLCLILINPSHGKEN